MPETINEKTLEIKSIYKKFAEHPVIENFSLTLPKAGTIALMGASGCGKTTLLRIIAGLEKPDKGEIVYPENLKLSMVFQEDRLIDVLDGLGNVMAVLKQGEEERALYCLEKCGLLEAKGLYPAQMSGGMKRRLAVARAVAYGGTLMLMDEPFSGLDKETKLLVQRFVFADSYSENRLNIIVTHDRDEAVALADIIYYLEGPPLGINKVNRI